VFSQNDKCNHGEADERADYQRQGKENLLFALGREHKPALKKAVRLRFGSYFGGRNTHSF
jgi:hypothetical protein